MAKYHKPVKGSRAFWPKKRAARAFKPFTTRKGEGILGFAGYKVGMTQAVVTDGRKNTLTAGQDVIRPVTVIQVPPLFVCGVRAYKEKGGVLQSVGTQWTEKQPKHAHRLPLPKKATTLKGKPDDWAMITLICCTQPHEALAKKKPEVFELRLGGDVETQWTLAQEQLGKPLAASDVFQEGDWVDVRAVSTGKGFQGSVKRFGVKVRDRKSHGKFRHIGNIGSVGQGRVFPGAVAMPGQLGYQTRTELNKRIVAIGKGKLTPASGWLRYGTVDGDYLIVSGSVPGPKKRLIFLRKGVRTHHKSEEKDEFKNVLLHSQQGK